jgi:hypothetical protein
MSALGPACVKTRTSGEGAELFSPFASFDGDCQCCCFSIQRNLDKISTRKFDVGVFAQPASDSDLGERNREVRLPPVTDINDRLDERPLRADFVAKVFLRHGTQILRAIGATIE